MLRYYATAATLGLGWFAVLMVPDITRLWLLDPNVWWNLATLVASSLIVAATCRRFIQRSETVGDDLLRAVVVPYFGVLVVMTLLGIGHLRPNRLVVTDINLHDVLAFYLSGVLGAVISFFVIIPYGYVCQRVMRNAAERVVIETS